MLRELKEFFQLHQEILRVPISGRKIPRQRELSDLCEFKGRFVHIEFSFSLELLVTSTLSYNQQYYLSTQNQHVAGFEKFARNTI